MRYRSVDDEKEQARLNYLGTSFEGVEDMCRHELVPETDLNRILKRYAPFELPQGQVFYGERDYDLDNAEAMHRLYALREQALSKWRSMSDEERSPWPTLAHFMTAVEAPVSPAAAAPVAPAQGFPDASSAGAPPATPPAGGAA